MRASYTAPAAVRDTSGGRSARVSLRPTVIATPSSAAPRAVPRPVARTARRRRTAMTMPVAAKTTDADGSQNPATSSTWNPFRSRARSSASSTVTSVCATGIRLTNGMWSSASFRRLTRSVTGARSTVTAPSRFSRSARITASCAAMLAASHAVRYASVSVNERTASRTKWFTGPWSLGRTWTSRRMSSVTPAAMASRTSSSPASGAMVASYRSESPRPYVAHADSAPGGARRQASAISTADRALRTRGDTPSGKASRTPYATGPTANGRI